MPVVIPEEPQFEGSRHGERVVWEALSASLPDDAVLLHSVWLLDGAYEREADLIVAWPGVGLAVVEVKGGRVARHDGQWCSERGNSHRRIRSPATQAQDARHALDRYLKDRRFPSLRAVHMVALPHMTYPESPAEHELPRRQLLDRSDLDHIVDRVRSAIERCGWGTTPTDDDIAALVELFAGRPPRQPSLFTETVEHEDQVAQMTRDQLAVLNGFKYQRRMVVLGGAGTGKTWLAIEQARRLAASGERVALLCYSRGLGRFLRRTTATWADKHQPAYVGLFHELADHWGSPEPPHADADEDYWTRELPLRLADLADHQPPERLFDAVVVDEAQDFDALWWRSLVRCLREPESGRLYLFLDEAQRVFSRHGALPIDAAPYVLDRNVRNTKRIGQTFQSLSTEALHFLGMDGQPVRFVQASSTDVVVRADDAVEALIEEGFEPGDIALLTTHHRHPAQAHTVHLEGWVGYWDAFFEASDVFYGHVLGFKGLERAVVVLAVNGLRDPELGRGMLYVGLSRARSLLVVVGDLDAIETIGGTGIRKRLEHAEQWAPGISS